jgi:hypothetical protein
MSSAQVAEWRKTGDAPKDAVAESSPAEPVEQVASTEAVAAPASEAGQPTKKKNAESRKQELQAEIDGLLKTRAQLRAEVQAPVPAARPDVIPAAPSPAASLPDYDTWATAQPPGADTRYERYAAEFTLAVAAEKADAYRAQQAHQAAVHEAEEVKQAYLSQAEAFVQDHPDYWSKVNPITRDVPSTPTTEVMGNAIARSSAPTKLLYHLGTHREEFQRIVSLPPGRAVYELGKLDAVLFGSSVPPVSRTSAPPPVDGLSTRAVAPVDDVDAALASGDFSRYKAAQNARDVAARRR